MRVGLLYERKEWFPFEENDPEDLNSELLSEEEEQEIVAGLEEAGHQVVMIGDVERLVSRLDHWRKACDIVFNRSVGYRGVERKSIAAAVLEAAGIPYTGSTPYVLSLTRNKYHSKVIAAHAGLLTPAYAVLCDGMEACVKHQPYPAIVKPIAESSSIGIEAGESIVRNPAEAQRRAGVIAQRYHQPALVEEFIEGLEVEVPLVADKSGVLRVFGLAVVTVNNQLPEGKHYLASDQVYVDNYDFVDPPANVDIPRLMMLAERGARALGMRDYGRLDFRIDAAGRMWFIEASTHPHVQVHSGFNHAASRRGMSYPAMLDNLVQTGLRRYRASAHLRSAASG
jgi:D-alanine-D-alanine ligase